MPHILGYISGRVKGLYNYRIASRFTILGIKRFRTLWDKQEYMHVYVMSIFLDDPIQGLKLKLTNIRN